MRKKRVITCVMAASFTLGSLLPAGYASAKEDSKTTPSYEELALHYKMKSEKISSNGKLVEIEYVSGNETHKVQMNGNDHTVKVDGIEQKGLNFEYDENVAKRTNYENNNLKSNEFTTQAAKPKKGYHYVGTLSGHTKAAKNALSVTMSLVGIVPGLGWGSKAATILFSYWAKEQIPDAYYKYDLYEKGAMIDSWYQYATVQFFEDKAHKKKMGKPWTSTPAKVDLPNS
ncbi:hypothetical protein P9C69_10440 [Bacillus subtilis]|uniref:hypothetical protein n=1 Tax=Bacillus subtilis TaxID=1423 RepID=UPI002DB5D680|nr:hypothetical protein [Bacillus subtilis]MEC1431129.1 hypothetical protein [Bacillus subtilis]